MSKMYDPQKKYIAQVHLSVATADDKDCLNFKMPGVEIENFFSTVYTKGLMYKVSPNMTEIISPFRINHVYLLLEDTETKE